ncbi:MULTISPECIES: phosphotransferase [unclassified Streptomyces]|uniref:phosphotransferase n=1 Tax=unclassified Streptomyces TaxID=2593676 RepID=UPI002E303467|nr:phosphotransferase [Streptomyces sp. NBC_01361]
MPTPDSLLGAQTSLSSHTPRIASQLTPETVAALCRIHFGSHAQNVTMLGGEVASNARVDTPDGPVMFKAVATSATSDSQRVEAQIRWQIGVSNVASAAGLPVPANRRTLDGDALAVIAEDGRELLVQVSDWMPGRTFVEAGDVDSGEPGLALREDLGRKAGALARAIAERPAPEEPNDHEWSFECMSENIRAGLAGIPSTGPGALALQDIAAVERIVGWFETRALPLLPALPRGVTHHDLNDFNVLVDTTAPTPRVSGIIDFDDAREGPLVAEPAIAGGYSMLGCSDPLAALAAVIAGYRRERPLSDAELVAVFPGAAARLCLNAVVWTSRHEGTAVGYGAARTARTWPTIRAVARLNPDMALERITPAA